MFWQLSLREKDRHKSAFMTPQGLFEFTRVPMGMKGSAAACQRIMNAVLHGLSWKIALVYIDDIIVFSKSFDDHLDDVDRVCTRLTQAGVTLNIKKCSFFQREIRYLGRVISGKGIKANPEKISAILDLAKPIQRR